MKTFNGSQELKNELLKQLKHHQELDAFIQGQWLTDEKVEGNGFKGCFYGCTMQTDDNPREKFSEKYNIPLWYCYLTEKIFEGLPKEEAKEFPYKSIEIIPVGIEMHRERSIFNKLMLTDQLRFCNDNEEATNAIKKCISLFDVEFNLIEDSAAWSAAKSAAKSAAWSAAWSAWSAAKSAAWSAAWSARSAARSAATAATAAESDYYNFLAKILIGSFKK